MHFEKVLESCESTLLRDILIGLLGSLFNKQTIASKAKAISTTVAFPKQIDKECI